MIMHAELVEVKKPIMNPYDGEGDSLEHTKYYNNLMIGYRANDASMCRNFPSTLIKKASK
jgi:hypothetical protein